MVRFQDYSQAMHYGLDLDLMPGYGRIIPLEMELPTTVARRNSNNAQNMAIALM